MREGWGDILWATLLVVGARLDSLAHEDDGNMPIIFVGRPVSRTAWLSTEIDVLFHKNVQVRAPWLKECVLEQIQIRVCRIGNTHQIGMRVDLFDESGRHQRANRRLFHGRAVEFVSRDDFQVQINIGCEVGNQTTYTWKTLREGLLHGVLENVW